MLKGDLIVWNKQRWNIKKIDIWKVNEFNFLNEEVEELTRRWNQNLIDHSHKKREDSLETQAVLIEIYMLC